jgi:hypothetical protein
MVQQCIVVKQTPLGAGISDIEDQCIHGGKLAVPGGPKKKEVVCTAGVFLITFAAPTEVM